MQAASLNGVNLTSFVLATFIEKARQVVKDHNTTIFSTEGQQKLAQALRNPGQPTSALKNIMALPALENLDKLKLKLPMDMRFISSETEMSPPANNTYAI